VTIKIQDSAYKDLKKIGNPIAIKILKHIEKLQDYPNISNIKKLKNYNPTHRLRVGDYRVLFNIKDEIIIIGRIKHRKDAY
jgi:mRNA interferase RelE/StbE